MSQQELKPARLTAAQVVRVGQAFKDTGASALIVWNRSGQGAYIRAPFGVRVDQAIKELVRVAAIVHPDPVNLEVRFNGVLVRAHASDDPDALYQAWQRAPLGLDRVVKLEFDFTDPDDQPPRNNDGRRSCYWCGKPTRTIELATSSGDICTACRR